MYNPDQPRDANGRWAKTKAAGSFIGEHGDEIAIGLALAGGVALTAGAISVAVPSASLIGLSDDAAKFIINATKVRKVGPLDLGGIGKLIPPAKKLGLKSGEAFQYSKGFFDPAGFTNAATHTPLGRIGQPLRNLRAGAELSMKGGTRSFGAPKPLNYDKMVFKSHPKLTTTGTALIGAGTLVGTGSRLYKRDR